MLGDPTRLRICRLLLESGRGLCVCELVDALEEAQYNVSRHLKALKAAGLVSGRSEGRWVYYNLAAERSPFVDALLAAVRAIPPASLESDICRVQQRLRMRVDGRCTVGVQKPHLLSERGVTRGSSRQ